MATTVASGLADGTRWRTVLVYLACSPKPAWEMLAPREPADFEATFSTHFPGMTCEPVSVEQLLQSRARLLERVAAWLDNLPQLFLRSVEAEQPDFGLIDQHLALDLPGVRRKLRNLDQRSEVKRQADRLQLEQALARIAGRAG